MGAWTSKKGEFSFRNWEQKAFKEYDDIVLATTLEILSKNKREIRKELSGLKTRFKNTSNELKSAFKRGTMRLKAEFVGQRQKNERTLALVIHSLLFDEKISNAKLTYEKSLADLLDKQTRINNLILQNEQKLLGNIRKRWVLENEFLIGLARAYPYNIPKEFTIWLESTPLSLKIKKKLVGPNFSIKNFSSKEYEKIQKVFKSMPLEVAFAEPAEPSYPYIFKINLSFGIHYKDFILKSI